MGNQASSSPPPTPSHSYQGDRYGAAVVATDMENHGAPQKLQRPYNNHVISSDKVRICGHYGSNMENHGAPQKLKKPYNNPVINSDDAVRIYGGICVTEKYDTNSTRTNKPTPGINRNRRSY
ncbi:hypothetical protein ACE6H2_001247 [Prunus campanulata]